MIKYLKKRKYIPNYSKSIDHYSNLSQLTNEAIERANRIIKFWKDEIDRGIKIYDLNPYTDVNLLVKALIKL